MTKKKTFLTDNQFWYGKESKEAKEEIDYAKRWGNFFKIPLFYVERKPKNPENVEIIEVKYKVKYGHKRRDIYVRKGRGVFYKEMVARGLMKDYPDFLKSKKKVKKGRKKKPFNPFKLL